MKAIDPEQFFDGPVLVAVPHMDDEILACGGTLMRMPRKRDVHLVYCTDGRGILGRHRAAVRNAHGEADIGAVRKEETRRALAVAGVLPSNVRFLDFPEWRLARHAAELRAALGRIIEEIRPAYVLAPFRFDKHVDHVALFRAVKAPASRQGADFRLLEYFVYYRWKLLPGGDVRHYVRPECLLKVDLSAVTARKREALECFVSQTTRFYPWQRKPVLSSELLRTFSAGPELFLDAGRRGGSPFRLPVCLLAALNRVEPVLKNTKERILLAGHTLGRRRLP